MFGITSFIFLCVKYDTIEFLINLSLWSANAGLCGKDSVFGEFHIWGIVWQKYLDYGGFK